MVVNNDNPVGITYISSACNCTPCCADWNSDGIICFGASNSVALFDTNYDGSAKITNTLVRHTGKVNSVRWIRSDSEFIDCDIISGSMDGTAIVWTKTGDTYNLASLVGHKDGVTVADARYITCQNDLTILYAATASVDSTIKIWRKSDDEIKCIQTIELGSGLCLTLQLFSLPGANIPVLACGLDDNKIHLYIEKENNQYEKIFFKVQVLLGHEDWVRGLDFVRIDNKLMLASCSQDTHIRLWSIEPHSEIKTNSEDIKIERKVFKAGNTDWAVSLNAVLSGHEGWVYGVHWNYNLDADGSKINLLSASIDKSLIIWEPDITDGVEGVWMEKVRVGEVGGSGLGFYGGKLSHRGDSIMGHGYAGSFHLWKLKKDVGSWEPAVVCGGHFNEVVDLGWEPEGQFLISVSTDQTTRVHAPWVKDSGTKTTWHELARPQIHGFDMSCLAIISKFSFATGAEEKVIRTFQAPSNFVSNFHNICGSNDADETDLPGGICQGASVPSLGLSNKAVYSSEKPADVAVEKHVKDLYPDNYFVPVKMQEPPTEETLMQNTLWPEMHKLYGHGYEVFSLAASSDSTLLASACKATTAQHATILIWDTSTWVQIQSLSSHHLTITQLSFSPDSQSLLSVSRDRRWSVFRRDAYIHFTLVGSTDKSNGIHTRIIWCCAWTHDSQFFFTGSRDGKIVMWGKSEDITRESSIGQYHSTSPPLELKTQSVTALATAPRHLSECYLLAAGFESGLISLYRIQQVLAGKEWQLLITLDNNTAHHLTVKRLSFRPNKRDEKNFDSNVIQLASGSCDHSVKIYELNLAQYV